MKQSIGNRGGRAAEFFNKTYMWMFIGLVLSGLVALLTSMDETIFTVIFGNGLIFIGLIIVELALVVILSGFINKISATAATIMFLLYAFINGLTFSVIFFVYTLGSISTVFFVTALMFGAMGLYGYTTKRDLTGMGSFLLMALIGIIIASVINLFLNNDYISYVVSFIAVIIFTLLTAYDVQRIKRQSETISDKNLLEKMPIVGALSLYLDFINLFLSLLRLFGRRR